MQKTNMITQGVRGGRNKLGDLDCHVHTTIYKTDNQQEPTVGHRNSTQYPVMLYMGQESKTEWVYVYVQLILFAVHLKLTQHCKSTIHQQKFFSKKSQSLSGKPVETHDYEIKL